MNYYDDLDIPFASHVKDGHCRAHTPLYYGIQYNQSGTLELQIGDGPKRLVSGPLVFITHPGAQFTYHLMPGEKHNYYAVCFMGGRVRKFIEGGLLSLEPEVYPIHDREKFMQTILDLMTKRCRGQKDICVNLLENLLLQIKDSREQDQAVSLTPYQAEELKKLAYRIRQRYGEEWDFAHEARKFFISERHFRTLFAQVNGQPPLHFLLQIRLEQAAERLIHTRNTVSSIAEECGFQDGFYFSRLFRKYYHFSPKQYRQEFGSFS